MKIIVLANFLIIIGLLGLSDLIKEFISIFGWLEFLVGDNNFSKIIGVLSGLPFGWLKFLVGNNDHSILLAVMVLFGLMLLKNQKEKDNLEKYIETDLEPDEIILFKRVGLATAIALTNKKILFRVFDGDGKEYLAKKFCNAVVQNTIIRYVEIKSVRTIKMKEVGNSRMHRLLNLDFGFSLKMKDGTTKNLATKKAVLITNIISNYLK